MFWKTGYKFLTENKGQYKNQLKHLTYWAFKSLLFQELYINLLSVISFDHKQDDNYLIFLVHFMCLHLALSNPLEMYKYKGFYILQILCSWAIYLHGFGKYSRKLRNIHEMSRKSLSWIASFMIFKIKKNKYASKSAWRSNINAKIWVG